MSILSWIILGALAGWITSLIAGSREDRFANVVVGIIGACVGGVVLKVFGTAQAGFDVSSLLTAVLGAAILIGLIRHVHRPTI